MLVTLAVESLAALAYGVVGIALMALGYVVLDLVTPGRLHELVWVRRNRNASTLVASNVLGLGVIVCAAIWASEGSLVEGLLGTLVFGVVGIVLMTLAFFLLDLLTPGRLGHLLVEDEPHPAVWVSAAIHLAVGFVVALALS